MKNIEREAIAYKSLKAIAEIIKEIESDKKVIEADVSLEKPIMSELIVSKSSMGYNRIKAEVKNFKTKMKNESR